MGRLRAWHWEYSCISDVKDVNFNIIAAQKEKDICVCMRLYDDILAMVTLMLAWVLQTTMLQYKKKYGTRSAQVLNNRGK